MTMTDAEVIAKGGQPAWTKTFPHREHGDLTFTVPRLPTGEDWLEHAMAQQDIGPGLTGAAGLLAASVAAMRTFMQAPVIREDRVEDPDNPDHVKLRQIHYDPMQDVDIDFPQTVWLEFLTWRMKLLADDSKEQVKNSSGATSGGSDDASSPATTDSPQPAQP